MSQVPNKLPIESQLALAIDHQAHGRLQAAESICKSIVASAPSHLMAWNLLAIVSAQMGNYVAAVDGFHRALLLAPGSPQLLSNLANAYAHQGLCREAIRHYEMALQLDPSASRSWSNLGDVLAHLGESQRARACFERALQLDPQLAETWASYAKLLDGLSFPVQADHCYARSVQLRPARLQTHLDRAQSYANRTEYWDAMIAFERALQLDPNSGPAMCGYLYQAQQMGHWDHVESVSQKLIAIIQASEFDESIEPIPPYALLTMPFEASPRMQLSNARRWVKRHLKSADRCIQQSASPSRVDRRIRIGYISGDFRPHPMATLVVDILEGHDRIRFHVHGYSVGVDDASSMRQRIKNAFESFVDLNSMSNDEAAQRIASDEIQILVDLSGFTYHARPEIVAARPAPIQVSYMGFAGTLGAPFIDYLMLDDFIAPIDKQPFYSERIVHLPKCYMSYDSQRTIASTPPSRAECGLPEHAFVFCSFNNSHKITRSMFRSWMEILREVPQSVLWLLESNRWISRNLRAEAQRLGMDPDRLIFSSRILPDAHLSRHQHADLFLDTFPYGAHTTACESLYVGCPIVTLCGSTMISRVAGSLLRALDLQDLITYTLEDYQRKAIELATSSTALAGVRNRLKENRVGATLFDGRLFAKDLESAYRMILEHHYK